MSAKTAIQWTDATWNPFTGCSRVSAGCKNCYAFQVHDMRHKAWLAGKKLPIQYAHPFSTIQFFTDRFLQPLSWKKPRRIFVNSMSDLFHESTPFEFIEKIWATMAMCPQHTFQILTKRPARALEFFEWEKTSMKAAGLDEWWKGLVTLPNVQIGVSVENQAAADERIPLLAKIPAAWRFLSCEPLLGPLDLEPWLPFSLEEVGEILEGGGEIACSPFFIDWVIVGGESGKGARPMCLDWARSLRDQTKAAGVPFFFKQWGEWAPIEEPAVRQIPMGYFEARERGLIHNWSADQEVVSSNCSVKIGKKRAGRLLDGCEWNEFPGAK